MCGIAGTLNFSSDPRTRPVVQLMIERLIHRGPDDGGVWSDERNIIGLAHRRLSVIDLSDAASQPMVSGCGRYVLVYNGEIYNHVELRQRLRDEGNFVSWRSSSDTETLLTCFSVYGIEKTLRIVVGMFAIGLWDKADQTLTLARDRLGEKPLYYGSQGRSIIFGSELDGLRQHHEFEGEINRDALALLMRYGYIPAPYSIYRGIHKLLPGMFVQFNCGGNTKCKYWDFSEIVSAGMDSPFIGTYGEAVRELDSLLGISIERQMVSDVPLGCFLSGGIDSSTVVAIAQARSTARLKTFSIGFDEDLYNEAGHAKVIAEHVGTDHTEFYVTPQDARAVIPKLPLIYSEPFADSSQIPTYLVSEMARRDVTVSLSGDAGDELFAGYNRHVLVNKYWPIMRYVPVGIRRILSSLISSVSPENINLLSSQFARILKSSYLDTNMGGRFHKAAGVIDSGTPALLYKALVSQWDKPNGLIIGAREPLTLVDDFESAFATDSLAHQMMALDTVSYLPDDILCKVDRAAMAVSLETRIPFLDHRVVEFAWKLPLSYKLRNGVGKSVLRDVLYQYVPKRLVERPKMGFSIPLGDWLRGPLRDWAEELLSEDQLSQDGYFNPVPIREKWLDHLNGKRNWQHHLWNVLMFQAWLKR